MQGEQMNRAIIAFAGVLAAGIASAQGLPAIAAAAAEGGAQAAPSASAPDTDYSDAEVRRVDKDAQKVTLRHGPIPNLGMGNMTMVFRVSETRWLEGLKAGDKVRFKADKVGGQYTVTAIEPVR